MRFIEPRPPYHVYPVDDLFEHDLTGDTCGCEPVVELFENGSKLVIHNSYDGRELLEQARAILNT